MTSDPRSRMPFVPLILSVLVALVGCGDSNPAGPEAPSGEPTAVVVNSVELTLTVFPLDDPDDRRTIALGPEGTPVGGAVRGAMAAIPMGVVPALAIVDLRAGEVVRTVALAEGSGATGALFVNDSIVLVGNPGLDQVSPVNAVRGTVGEAIPAGGYPQGLVQASGRIFVLNAELVDFSPDGPGTLTVLDAETLAPVDQIVLSGQNTADAVVGPGGSLMVLTSGSWGEGDGGLSVVDPDALVELDSHSGFGDLPGSLAVLSGRRLFASSWSYGLVEWNPAEESFVRGPDDAHEPGGMPSSAGVAVDPEGGLWSLIPECQGPGSVLRLDSELQVLAEIPVGVCPSAILFTQL